MLSSVNIMRRVYQKFWAVSRLFYGMNEYLRNPYDIPILSLHIQENLLFDYTRGIYTPGIDFDTFRRNNPEEMNTHTILRQGNYFRRGSQWEYPAQLEVFYPGISQAVINQAVGFRIHGNDSRGIPIKSLRIYARKRYDDSYLFDYPFFTEKVAFASNPGNDLYQRILMRGQGSGGPFMFDWIAHKLMQPVYEGMPRTFPVIQFINGEYWGLTAVRDRFDEYHLAFHYDLDPNNIIITWKTTLDSGIPSDMMLFNQMQQFVNEQDMSDNINYKHLKNMLDIRSYVDHIIPNIYLCNTHYEYGFWRARQPSDDHFGDGKWRVYTQDFDMLSNGRNWLKLRASAESETQSHIFLQKLLKNTDFKNYFISRFADHINTTFNPARFESLVHEEYSRIKPYLDEDSQRWVRQYPISREINQQLITYAHKQPFIQRKHIRELLDIIKDVTVKLDVSCQTHGHIRINTIFIKEGTPGVSRNPYPWTGTYFSGIPIVLEAYPQEGYTFTGWLIENKTVTNRMGDKPVYWSNDPIVTLILSENASVRAVFEAI